LLFVGQVAKRLSASRFGFGVDGSQTQSPCLLLLGQARVTITITFAAIELLIDHRRDRRFDRAIGGLGDNLSTPGTKGSPLGFVAEAVKLGIEAQACVPGHRVAFVKNVVARVALCHLKLALSTLSINERAASPAIAKPVNEGGAGRGGPLRMFWLQ